MVNVNIYTMNITSIWFVYMLLGSLASYSPIPSPEASYDDIDYMDDVYYIENLPFAIPN